MRTEKSKVDSRRPACDRSLPSDWLRKAWRLCPICSIHTRCTTADHSDRSRDFRYDSIAFAGDCLVAPRDESPWDGSCGRADPEVVGSRGDSTIGHRSKGISQRHPLAAQSLDHDASISAPPPAPPTGGLSDTLGHLCAGYAALGAGRATARLDDTSTLAAGPSLCLRTRRPSCGVSLLAEEPTDGGVGAS